VSSRSAQGKSSDQIKSNNARDYEEYGCGIGDIDQFITTDEILRYNLKTNEPVTPPRSLLSLNYHIVEERHSTDDHVVLVGNDVAKDNDIHEVRKGKTSTTRRQSSMFSSNIERYYFENDRNIDDIDRFHDIFGGGDDEVIKDDSNDNVDKCKVDNQRPKSSFFIYNQIYNDDDSIKLVFADGDPKDDNNNIDKCKVDKLRP